MFIYIYKSYQNSQKIKKTKSKGERSANMPFKVNEKYVRYLKRP